MASVLRQDVTLQGPLAAWLWHPDGSTGCVIMGHGLSAVLAVVAQCPMTDGLKASLMTPKLTALKLAKAALQDEVGSHLGRKAKLIKAPAAPASSR